MVADLIKIISNVIYDQIPPILRLLIPLTLTIYLFNYKERKEVTTSYLKQKKMTLKAKISLILTVVLLTMFGLHFYLNVDSLISSLATIIICSVWIYSLYKTYRELFDLVDIFYVIDENLEILYSLNMKIKKNNDIQQKHLKYLKENSGNRIAQLKIFFGNLLEKRRRKKLKKYYSEFDIIIQIVSQILLSKSKYNLNKDVTSYLDQNLRIIQDFLEENKMENIFTLNLFKGHLDIYTSILENSIILLENSLKNGRYEDQYKLIKFLKEIVLGPLYISADTYQIYKNSISAEETSNYFINIQYAYLKSIKTVTTILHSYGYNGDLTMLRYLNLISKQGNLKTSMAISSHAVFTLQVTILIDAVMKNNIKLLTDIVNITLEKEDFPEDTLNVFNLCVIKSIEQGHYSCAGHLIKMIVKKFEGDEIESSLKNIFGYYVKKVSFSEVDFLNLCNDMDDDLGKEFMLNMPFSPISFKYCFSKLVYLLEIQYNFKNEDNKPPLKVYDGFKFDESVEYIQQKVLNLHKEYGLIVLKEELLFPSKQTV